MRFYTSDTHYGHGNIIRYCERPFFSTGDMNETMITAHNAVVGPDDEVIHGGDFAFGSPGYIRSIAERLHGRFRLVIGNHDRKPNVFRDLGWEVCKSLVIEEDGAKVFLQHRPLYDVSVWLRDWGHIDYHFHGHSHNRIGHRHPNPRIFDVGVDCRGFVPRTFDEIINM